MISETLPLALSVHCDGRDCGAVLDVSEFRLQANSRALDHVLGEAGWTRWVNRGARHYCPNHGPRPGHDMRLTTPRSEAHAPDPVDDTTTELGPLDDITYRSTGRGAYDVIRTRAEGPDTVLATVLFSEGVRGRVHGLEALVRSLRQTTQDVQP